MAALDSAAFDLTAHLERLSLDTDVYKGYIEGIMEDEDAGSLEERVEAVLGFLGSATEEDLSGFGEDLKRDWEGKKEAAAAKAGGSLSADREEEMQRYREKMEAEKKAAADEGERQAAELKAKIGNRDRDALLNKYAFGEDAVDEDGNVVAGKVGPSSDLELGAVFGANANKAQVLEAAKAAREKAKNEHIKKVTREKELLLKDKIKKEAEKRRTQKREKQRGCG